MSGRQSQQRPKPGYRIGKPDFQINAGLPWASLGVLLANTWLVVIPFPATIVEVKTSLAIAGAGLFAWFVGRSPGLAMCGAWAMLELALHSSQLNLWGLIVRTLVMAGLVWAISELKERLIAESRRGRLDPLTGLPNRQAFHERCRSELSRGNRFQRPLTLALLDGDRFKAVNDERGHAVGDLALQATADVLRETIRQYDFAARLGGDEFVVLFPETAADAAEAASHRLQDELNTRLDSEFSPLSYSLGVVTFPPGDWSVDECLRQADRKLYEAKRSGVGLVCFAVAEWEFSPVNSGASLPNG